MSCANFIEKPFCLFCDSVKLLNVIKRENTKSDKGVNSLM